MVGERARALLAPSLESLGNFPKGLAEPVSPLQVSVSSPIGGSSKLASLLKNRQIVVRTGVETQAAVA